jgi:hypothetical protein
VKAGGQQNSHIGLASEEIILKHHGIADEVTATAFNGLRT